MKLYFLSHLNLKFSELCVRHYELRKKKKAEEELAQENAHQSWKQQTPICYVQQQPMQPYEDDIRMNIQHSHYQPQDAGTERLNSVGVSDFCELESKFFCMLKYNPSNLKISPLSFYKTQCFGSSEVKNLNLILQLISILYLISICLFYYTVLITS